MSTRQGHGQPCEIFGCRQVVAAVDDQTELDRLSEMVTSCVGIFLESVVVNVIFVVGCYKSF